MLAGSEVRRLSLAGQGACVQRDVMDRRRHLESCGSSFVSCLSSVVCPAHIYRWVPAALPSLSCPAQGPDYLLVGVQGSSWSAWSPRVLVPPSPRGLQGLPMFPGISVPPPQFSWRVPQVATGVFSVSIISMFFFSGALSLPVRSAVTRPSSAGWPPSVCLLGPCCRVRLSLSLHDSLDISPGAQILPFVFIPG